MADADPWYRDGLRFQCTRCGNCCTGTPGFVWLSEAELHTLANYLGEDAEQFAALYTRRVGARRSLREKSNFDCIFYDQHTGCTVYEARPAQCRTWPFWDSNVRSVQAWQQTCSVCPGAGMGELIPAEEITRRLQVVRL